MLGIKNCLSELESITMHFQHYWIQKEIRLNKCIIFVSSLTYSSTINKISKKLSKTEIICLQ